MILLKHFKRRKQKENKKQKVEENKKEKQDRVTWWDIIPFDLIKIFHLKYLGIVWSKIAPFDKISSEQMDLEYRAGMYCAKNGYINLLAWVKREKEKVVNYAREISAQAAEHGQVEMLKWCY